MSLPLRERGLKCKSIFIRVRRAYVAPLAGAWIEINDQLRQAFLSWVAPLAGAWIEIELDFTLKRGIYRRSPCGSVD